MVMHAYLRRISMTAATVLFACNIEIGNPEPPPGMFRSLDFNLLSYAPCASPAENCTSVPVYLTEVTDSALSFEMTKARLELKEMQLYPYNTQSVGKTIDLLAGTTVNLEAEKDLTQVTEISLDFGLAHRPSYEIQGKLRIALPAETVYIPLTLSDEDNLLAQASVTAQGERITAVSFDANTWFDFSGTTPDMSNAIRNLTSGACKNTDSNSCQVQRENLAKQIGKKIARSLSVKTVPVPGKGRK